MKGNVFMSKQLADLSLNQLVSSSKRKRDSTQLIFLNNADDFQEVLLRTHLSLGFPLLHSFGFGKPSLLLKLKF